MYKIILLKIHVHTVCKLISLYAQAHTTFQDFRDFVESVESLVGPQQLIVKNNILGKSCYFLSHSQHFRQRWLLLCVASHVRGFMFKMFYQVSNAFVTLWSKYVQIALILCWLLISMTVSFIKQYNVVSEIGMVFCFFLSVQVHEHFTLRSLKYP